MTSHGPEGPSHEPAGTADAGDLEPWERRNPQVAAESRRARARHSRSRRGSRSLRGFSLGLLLLAVLGAIGWTAFEGWTLQKEANAAVVPLRKIDTSPNAMPANLTLLKEAAGHADKARAAGDSLPLRVASVLPFLGDDLKAARTLATGMDNVVSKAGIPMVGLVNQLVTKPATAPPGALINTEPLKTAGPTIAQAASAVATAHQQIESINQNALLAKVRGPVEEANRLLAPLDTGLTDANQYLPVLSDVLGASGKREYLLVFQNLAEARPTGGLIGKWATVVLDRSALQMTTIGTNEDLRELRLKQIPPMPADFMAMYSKSLGPIANANLTPDFPSAAKIILQTWKEQGHNAPAGVVSVDTKAIAGLLTLTGPITVPGPKGDVKVSSDNVVDIVQNRVYSWFEGQEQQRQQFLSALTAVTLSRLAKADVPMRSLATTLQDLAKQNSVQAYATNPKEQKAFSSLGVSGALPQPAATKALVYFTDNGGSKLDNYLAVGMCSSPSTIGLTLKNTLPTNYATFVPQYALNQVKGSAKGTNLITVAVYLPAGRGMSGVTVNGKQQAAAVGSEQNWSVVRIPLSIPASATDRIVLKLSGTGGKPALVTQPLTQSVTPANGVCNS